MPAIGATLRPSWNAGKTKVEMSKKIDETLKKLAASMQSGKTSAPDRTEAEKTSTSSDLPGDPNCPPCGGAVRLCPQEAVALEQALNQARQFAQSLNGWVVFQGGYGCGKTHLAAAIANFAG